MSRAGWSSTVVIVVSLVVLPAAQPARAQPAATLQGRVVDASGGVLRGARITVLGISSAFERTATTDDDGRYLMTAIPAGTYQVTGSAAGFRSISVESLTLEVGRTVVRDFRLDVGDTSEFMSVTAELTPIDRASAIVGHVVTEHAVHGLPLNGQHFIDLGLLAPGSVAPSQTGFSTTPIRGIGALAINTAGNREEAVAYVVNGVTSNNLTFGSLMFEPSVTSVQEFKIDNSVFSAEFGHVSGAVVNVVTRSGTDLFRGEAFDLVRSDVFDARNAFELGSEPHHFERQQFGVSAGGPAIRGKTWFFATYDGVRQQQGQDMNSLVLDDRQRATLSDPVVCRLVDLIPRANVIDPNGTARFVGSADASFDADRWTVDLRQNIGGSDRLHAFVGVQRSTAIEPATQGTTIPGFGTESRPVRALVTVGATHTVRPALINEARFGRSSLGGTGIAPATPLNPAEFGILNGVDRPIGLPQISVAGGLSFGGPANFPQGRTDASYIVTDTVSYLTGRHALRFGGEYRHFINENFTEGTGAFNFPSIASFMAGTANAFSITLGERRNRIHQRAVGLFFQDRVPVGDSLTVEAGLRYEWHVTPTEADNQFVIFDPATASLLRVGEHVSRIYRQNNRNVEPRLGLAWDVLRSGRTVVRGAYGHAADEPGTTAVRDTASNPPFATPLSASGAIPLAGAVTHARPVGLAPATIDPMFANASLQSWNVDVQQRLTQTMAAAAGYVGSRGRDLRISRNLNQPVDGARPFPALSASSPIRPGVPLGNVTQVESTGFSSYHALWLSVSRRLARGLQFDTSFTWSKSIDTNSLNSTGFAVQDSYDIPNQYGLSDFDARCRFVFSGIYQLPFEGHALTRGWQIAAIVQAQSGNPVNLVTSDSVVNGTPNTVRPDVTGPIRIVGTREQWFDTSVFVAADRFGDLGRNVVIGPGFRNTDVSLMKDASVRGRWRLRFRADVFNLFNHVNLGPPGNVVGSPTFGRITRTRLPTGEAGSARQIQFGITLTY
jgi:hypothetical protein